MPSDKPFKSTSACMFPRSEVVRGGVEPPTFRFQVNTYERCADLRLPRSLASGSALGGMWAEAITARPTVLNHDIPPTVSLKTDQLGLDF